MGMTPQRLRARLLAALGLPCAGLGVSCRRAEPHAPPPFAEPPPSGRAAWTVSYSLGPNAPEWCATGTAQCQESGGACPGNIQSTCSCGPGQYCGGKQSWECAAEYEPSVSSRERACCYALQQHCMHPAAGRALRQEGEPIFAPAVLRGDWLAALGFELDRDAARAAHFLRVAAAEHASIASFARATLSLLALGAPPELLIETERAALDEIRHARLAYALAAAFSGEACGPGPLPLPVRLEPDLVAFARATLHDACVEESRGTLELAAEARAETHAGLRAKLSSIADDEARHVELAFRSLAWALSAGREAVGAALREELQALREKSDPAVREVVIPCLESLLGTAESETRACGAASSLC